MSTPEEWAKVKSLEDGDTMFFPVGDRSKPLTCCDCSLVHQVKVHHVTSLGVTLEISRDDVETENARRGRGLRDPLYVEGYERGEKSRDAEIAELRKDLETVMKGSAAGGRVFGQDCSAVMRKYGWRWSPTKGWQKG